MCETDTPPWMTTKTHDDDDDEDDEGDEEGSLPPSVVADEGGDDDVEDGSEIEPSSTMISLSRYLTTVQTGSSSASICGGTCRNSETLDDIPDTNSLALSSLPKPCSRSDESEGEEEGEPNKR